jgi:hypothetical protein
VLEHAEYLERALPWKNDDTKAVAAVRRLRALGDFTDELVTVSLEGVEEKGLGGAAEQGFVLVAPRFFRGQAVEEEYGAFLAYCAMIERGLDSVLRGGASSGPVRVVPLHPKCTDLTRRAPHPALLFLKA